MSNMPSASHAGESAAPVYLCVFPTHGDGVTVAPEGVRAAEPMVWTVPDTVPKNAILGVRGMGKRLWMEGILKKRVLTQRF
jgi:hypothetical protein